MAKYLKPRYKIYRRENLNLFLKNRFALCVTKSEENEEEKKNIEYLPSHFYFQLKEKQRLKIIYGVLENQFKSYYYKSKKMKGKLSDNLIKILESRLDNVVYRMGIGLTRSESRQIVNHGCILVNNISVNIPSYLVRIGDVLTIKEKCKKHKRIIKSFNMFYKNNYYFD